MERMTEKEREMLLSLQAKAKRIERAEAAFLKTADARAEELMERWGASDRLREAAAVIGTDADTLFEWITSEAQIEYFRRKHKPGVPQEDTTGDDANILRE